MQVNLLRTESGDTHSAHFGADVVPHALDSGLKVVAHHFDGYWRVSRLCRFSDMRSCNGQCHLFPSSTYVVVSIVISYRVITEAAILDVAL